MQKQDAATSVALLVQGDGVDVSLPAWPGSAQGPRRGIRVSFVGSIDVDKSGLIARLCGCATAAALRRPCDETCVVCETPQPTPRDAGWAAAAHYDLPATLDFVLVDSAGQERFRALTGAFFRHSTVVVLCYDTACAATLAEVAAHAADAVAYSAVGTPLLVCGVADGGASAAAASVARAEGLAVARAVGAAFVVVDYATPTFRADFFAAVLWGTRAEDGVPPPPPVCPPPGVSAADARLVALRAQGVFAARLDGATYARCEYVDALRRGAPARRRARRRGDGASAACGCASGACTPRLRGRPAPASAPR